MMLQRGCADTVLVLAWVCRSGVLSVAGDTGGHGVRVGTRPALRVQTLGRWITDVPHAAPVAVRDDVYLPDGPVVQGMPR